MREPLDQIERIEDYLIGNFSEQEATVLKQELESSPELKEQLQLQELIMQSTRRSELRAEVLTARKGTGWGGSGYWIAGVTLLGLLVVTFLFLTKSDEEVEPVKERIEGKIEVMEDAVADTLDEKQEQVEATEILPTEEEMIDKVATPKMEKPVSSEKVSDPDEELTTSEIEEAIIDKDTMKIAELEVIIQPFADELKSESNTLRNLLETETETVYTQVNDMPSYPGGEAEMKAFFDKNIQCQETKWGENDQNEQREGKVYVSFVVNTLGEISDVEIKKGIAKVFDDEAVRIVKLMPKWNPGKQDGVPVKVSYILPITFKYY